MNFIKNEAPALGIVAHAGKLLQFALLALLLAGCTKDTTTDSDLVGNWKRSFEYEGVGRTEAVAFTIGNTIYVGGGYDGTDRLIDFWAYDQVTGTWLRKADFPGVPRNSAIAFAINGKGYMGTGIDDDDNKLKDMWEYDPAIDKWKQKADFAGTGRYNAVGFTLNEKGYIATGYDGNYLKDMWEYEATTDSWTQKASLAGSKRSEAVVFVYENHAYIVTGMNNGTYLNDFWMYDQATNTWTEKRKISDATDDSFDDDYDENIKRSNASIFIMAGKAYLVAGSKSGVTNSVWAYDIKNDLWEEKTNFEGPPRDGAIGFSINDRGYIVTGSNSSYRFDDLWEFFPETDQDDDDN